MSKRATPVKEQGNVYLRPGSPYWQISYWNGWHPERESTHTTDYTEAVKTLQRKLGKVAVGKSAAAERIRTAALLQLVVEDYRLHDRADLHEAEQRINRLLKLEFGHLRAAAFTTRALNAYIGRRQKEGRQNSTINRELALLRRSFRLGYEHDLNSCSAFRSLRCSRKTTSAKAFWKPTNIASSWMLLPMRPSPFS